MLSKSVKESIILSLILTVVVLYTVTSIIDVSSNPYKRYNIKVPEPTILTIRSFSLNCTGDEADESDILCKDVSENSTQLICNNGLKCTIDICDLITDKCICNTSVSNQLCYIQCSVQTESIIIIRINGFNITYTGSNEPGDEITIYYNRNNHSIVLDINIIDAIRNPVGYLMVSVCVLFIICHVIRSFEIAEDNSYIMKLIIASPVACVSIGLLCLTSLPIGLLVNCILTVASVLLSIAVLVALIYPCVSTIRGYKKLSS